MATFTKEEFKTEVAKLFATGKEQTSELYTKLSELINKLVDSINEQPNTPTPSQPSTNGITNVVLTGQAKDQQGKKWEGIKITQTGNTLNIDMGPWYGTYLRELNMDLTLADLAKAKPLNGLRPIEQWKGFGIGQSGVDQGINSWGALQFGINGLRKFHEVTYLAKTFAGGDAATQEIVKRQRFTVFDMPTPGTLHSSKFDGDNIVDVWFNYSVDNRQYKYDAEGHAEHGVILHLTDGVARVHKLLTNTDTYVTIK